MKVAVYGTLKRKKGNHHRLGGSPFVREDIVIGYKLFNAGFPVAIESELEDAIAVEVFDIGDDYDVLESLDWLEGYHGPGPFNFYDRIEVETNSGLEVYMYVKGGEFEMDGLPPCPIIEGVYRWG